jgi:hypothetical protein
MRIGIDTAISLLFEWGGKRGVVEEKNYSEI